MYAGQGFGAEQHGREFSSLKHTPKSTINFNDKNYSMHLTFNSEHNVLIPTSDITPQFALLQPYPLALLIDSQLRKVLSY